MKKYNLNQEEKFLLDERLMDLLTDRKVSKEDKDFYTKMSILNNALKTFNYDMVKDKDLWLHKLSEDDSFKDDLIAMINSITEKQENKFQNKIKAMTKNIYGEIAFSLVGLVLFLSSSISNNFKIASLVIYFILLLKVICNILGYYKLKKNIFNKCEEL